jgi:inhibitor of KinA
MSLTPTLRPVADTGVLVEFADHIDDGVHQRVLNLDAAIQSQAPTGITEQIPAYASLFVGYDALVTDYETMCRCITTLLNVSGDKQADSNHWQIPVCYDSAYAPDMPELCERLNLSTDEIIEYHTSARYKVYMYGFAPGYAYLGGVPESIHIPRKPGPVMDIPVGSVMIAGPQSLITTVVMPSGWWVIGRTTHTPLQADSDRPFLFNVGDTLEFVAVTASEFQGSR